MIVLHEGKPGNGPLLPMVRITRILADGRAGVSFMVAPEHLERVQTALDSERHQVYAISEWGALP